MKPNQVKAASAALSQLEALIEEWRKAKLITYVCLYYNGHPSRDIRDENLMEAVRDKVVNHYHNAVLDQVEVLVGMSVDVSGMLPDDWE